MDIELSELDEQMKNEIKEKYTLLRKEVKDKYRN